MRPDLGTLKNSRAKEKGRKKERRERETERGKRNTKSETRLWDLKKF